MVTAANYYTWLVGLCGLPIAASVSYLLVLLLAATIAKRKTAISAETVNTVREPFVSRGLKAVVIVPAHNEEQVLAATLDSLKGQDYPRSLVEIVVVADNCTDATAKIAKQYGATVLQRFDIEQRGKGYALDWAITQLLGRQTPPDAFIVIDADTWAAPNFIRLMTEKLYANRDDRGCCALQCRYGVLNIQEGWRAGLMAAAFDLYNHVRPMGSDQIGLSVILKGNGMGFTREVLQLARWQGSSITEDMDYTLDLIRNHDIAVGYVPEALVLAQMPITGAQGASQRKRWEEGRLRLLRERALPLVVEALRRRSLVLFDAAVGLLVPPLAELAALLLIWGCLIGVGSAAHMFHSAGTWIIAYVLMLTGYAIYILGGLRVAGAPKTAYVALLKAPIYVLWKFALYAARYAKVTRRPKKPDWVRTERMPIAVAYDRAAEGTSPESTLG